MSDQVVKSLIVNKEILLRQEGSNKLLKLSVGHDESPNPVLFVNGKALYIEDPKEEIEDEGPMYPKFGKGKLVRGKCTVMSFAVTERTCVQLTPCSKLEYGVISGDLTVTDIIPGLSFSVESMDPVEQTIIETDSREFFWYIM